MARLPTTNLFTRACPSPTPALTTLRSRGSCDTATRDKTQTQDTARGPSSSPSHRTQSAEERSPTEPACRLAPWRRF
jgi:hypothetical protein